MRFWQDVRYLAPIALLCSMSACAVNSPAEIRVSEGQVTQLPAIFLPPEDDEQPLRREFRRALEQTLAARNTAIDANAPLVADFGISALDAGIGQVVDSGDAKPAATIDWQAEPRRGLLLDSCEAKRTQATLAIFDRASGELVYRGEAQATVCDASETDLGQLAQRLIDDTGLNANPAP